LTERAVRKEKQRGPAGTEAGERLDVKGYAVLPSIVGDHVLGQIRAELAPYLGGRLLGRNDFEGRRTERVYALLAKAPSVAELVAHPRVISIIDQLLEPGYLLSANLAINLHPGETAQALHYDDAFYPLRRPRPPISVSVIWAIDDFTADNGATQVIVGSHRWDNRQPRDGDAVVPVIMPAGSALVLAGTLWHRGGANESAASRLAITPQYCQPWARQQEQMVLAVPQALAEQLSPPVQRLLGYSIRPPFMGHVDGMHPLRLLYPAYRKRRRENGDLAARILEGDGTASASAVADATMRAPARAPGGANEGENGE